MVNETELIAPDDVKLMQALPKWKNVPKLSALKEDLTSASSVQSAHKTKVQGWLDNMNIQGSAKVNAPKGHSQVVPQLIRKQAEWRYAALSEPFLSTADLFNVKPVTWEDREAAQQNQLLLNYQFNHVLNKQEFIDEYVRTAVDEGTVVMKTGWSYREVTEEVQVPIAEFTPDESFLETLQELDVMQQESPSQYVTDIPQELKMAHEMYQNEGVPYRPRVIGYEAQEQIKVVKNRPSVEICDFRNVIIDPTCQGDIKKASFVIYSFETNLSDLKKDQRYFNLEYLNIDNNSILGTPDHSPSQGTNNFQFDQKPRKKFVVHEYWGFWDKDGNDNLKPIVVSWVGDTIIRM